MTSLTRLFAAAVLSLTLALPASAAITWQTGPLEANGSAQFVFATDGSSAAAAFERDVLGDANVQAFLANFACWRLDAAQATAAGITAPALVIRDARGQQVWQRGQMVAAPELITALVINGPAAAPAASTPAAPAPAAAAPAPAAAAPAGTEVATDLRGDATDASLDLLSAAWAVNGPNLVLTVTVAGGAHIEGFHCYLDTDSNPATGYNTANILGADRMIEGAIIYTHAGAAQTDWNWTPGPAATYSSSGSVLTLTAPLAALGVASGQAVKVSFGTTDTAWASADWMPDGQSVTTAVP
jgi:hypothetical protein